MTSLDGSQSWFLNEVLDCMDFNKSTAQGMVVNPVENVAVK